MQKALDLAQLAGIIAILYGVDARTFEGKDRETLMRALEAIAPMPKLTAAA